MVSSKVKHFVETELPPLFRLGKTIWSIGRFLGELREEFVRKHFPESYYSKEVFDDIKTFRNSIRNFDSNQASEVPGSIVVEINNTCNLNCLMCATQQAKRKKGEMSLDLFEWIIRTIIKPLGRHNLVVHTVGEPLFYSDLPAILRICQKYGMRLHFTTNGLLLHKYIDLFHEYKGLVSGIAFSIDGASEETYEKIRRGGKFQRLLNNLELIWQYNQKVRKQQKISTSLQASISKDKFNDIPLFFEVFGKYFPPQKMLFGFVSNLSACHSEGDYYESKKLSANRLERLTMPCKVLWLQTHILWNGDVSICCRDYNGELVVGNVFEKTIPEIWKGDIYENYRNAHRKRQIETIPLCKDCRRMHFEAFIILNHYIHYLFQRFKNYPNAFYLENITRMLSYLNSNFTDDFLKSRKDTSLLLCSTSAKLR